MTERLYYTDQTLASFDAVVTSCRPDGDRFVVTLDRTAFYPTSGGQPFDTGTLGGIAVFETIDTDEGEVAHVVGAPLAPGARVSGAIDWPRRFDHMQQHTGQHVLSAAFDRLFQVRTESFHLGTAASTIDLGAEVAPGRIAEAEAEANRVVWDDRLVRVRFASAGEAASLPLRKEPARGGLLRLVDVEGFDLSACGGTHVARTGAIGIIAVTGWEKFRSGTRVEFLCGLRALTRLRQWRDALAALQRHLSVAPAEMADAAARLQDEAKAQQRSVRRLQDELAVHEARALLARGRLAGDRVVVAEVVDGWDAQGLKALAVAAASAEPRSAVALFTSAVPALAVVARGAAGGIDAGAVLKALVARFGGKGGGRCDLAQGGGLRGAPPELVAAAAALMAP